MKKIPTLFERDPEDRKHVLPIFDRHVLVSHADADRYHRAMDRPFLFTFEELASLMSTLPWEGIVWRHPDGRMAKLKRRDFLTPSTTPEEPTP